MLYLSHPACLEHDLDAVMPGHPERPARLQAIERTLEECDWLGWQRQEAPAASEAELELVHSAEHALGFCGTRPAGHHAERERAMGSGFPCSSRRSFLRVRRSSPS